MHVLNRILDSRAAGIQPVSLLCIVFFLSMSTVANAQERIELELKALSGIPVGQLGEHIGQAAWGIEFAGTYHLRGISFALGGHLAVANYGKESRSDILGPLPGSSPNETYSYDIFLFHLFARFELMKTGVKPYLDLLLGMKCFYAQSHTGESSAYPILIGRTFYYIRDFDSTTLHSDLALSYGLGGGIRIRIVEFNKSNGSVSLNLNLNTRYLFGGQSQYLRKGAIEIQDDRLIKEIHRSRSDLLFFSFGLSIRG